jgi:hypothetical protein
MPNRTFVYNYRARYGQTFATRRWGQTGWRVLESDQAEIDIARAASGQSTASFVRRHNSRVALLREVVPRLELAGYRRRMPRG